MPIYEFACDGCRSVVQVFFRGATSRVPPCPRCGAKGLRRLLSGFSVGGRHSGGGEGREPDGGPPEVEDAAVERAMSRLEGEMGSFDEEDPRQMGRLLRRVLTESGMKVEEGMEEALRRLEAGEDPERIEEELGDALDGGGGPGEEGDYSYDNRLYEG